MKKPDYYTNTVTWSALTEDLTVRHFSIQLKFYGLTAGVQQNCRTYQKASQLTYNSITKKIIAKAKTAHFLRKIDHQNYELKVLELQSKVFLDMSLINRYYEHRYKAALHINLRQGEKRHGLIKRTSSYQIQR